MNLQRFNELVRLGVPLMGAAEDASYWKGSSKQKSSSTTTSTPEQSEQYGNLLSGSDDWINSGGFDKNYGGSEGYDPVANFTPEQLAAIQGMAGTGQGLQDLYNGAGLSSLSDALGAYDPSKTGLNSALDNMYERSNFDFDTNQAGQLRQGAQAAGQFGSSRAGIAEGLARDRLSQNQLAASSNMALQDQQNWNTNRTNTLNNLSAITKGLNSGNTALYDSGALQQGQNQAEISGELQKWAYENNVSLNDLLAYKQLITGDMGGTNVSNSTSSGGGGNSGLTALGSFGGSALGSYFGGAQGGAAGAGIGGSLV